MEPFVQKVRRGDTSVDSGAEVRNAECVRPLLLVVRPSECGRVDQNRACHYPFGPVVLRRGLVSEITWCNRITVEDD